MLNAIKRKLALRLVVALIAISSAVAVCSIGYSYYSNKKTLYNDLNETVNNLLLYSAKSYGIPLWEFNKKMINDLNDALLLNKVIVAVNVKSQISYVAGRKKIDFKDLKGMTVELSEPYSIPESKDGLKIISGHVLNEGKEIGTIELFYTDHFVRKEIMSRVIIMLLIFLFASIAVVLLLYRILKKSFISPVLKLASISEEIAGNYDYSITVNNDSPDEIGVLYRGFNNMLDNIHLRDAELQKTKGFLNNIIESMPSMLISLDENGTVNQWNAAAEKLTGINAADILGKNLWNTDTYLNKLEKYFVDVISSRKPMGISRTQLEDGSEKENKYFNICLFPLMTNCINGAVVRIDDVTDIESKDQQLRQMQKMETVGTLAGGLAHDFNNILGGVVGTVSILKFKLKAGGNLPNDVLANYVDTIERAGKRAIEMVQQLLTLSRKKEMTFAPVELNDAIKDILQLCSNTFDKSVNIQFIHAGEKAFIMADAGQIQQVLLNICVNSSHAMTIMRPEGAHKGGTLSISLREITADKYFCSNHPEAEFDTRYWDVIIQDQGVGMDSKTIAKIFDPFFTTKDKGKGTGLGLAMVYGIIKQHQGFIDVYSEVGHGSTFSIYMPRLEAVEVEQTETKEISIAQGEGLVLVVDDEPTMRDLAKDILEEYGYTVMMARDGEEGVDVFRREHEKISLVILDMFMPKKSGAEAFIEMKIINPNLKVLLASGFRKDERIENMLRLGVKDFIQKPYTIDDLASKVSSVLKS